MNYPDYEYFDIILKSKDAIGNTFNTATPPVITGSTTQDLNFNLGSVYDTAPALQRYADSPYCEVKVKYFQIKASESFFATANAITIQVKLNVGLPQSLESKRLLPGNQDNLIPSQTIGVVPTSQTTSTYSSITYENQYVKSPNIFRGTVNVRLENQDDALITTLSKDTPYFMILCVKFRKEPLYFNNV